MLKQLKYLNKKDWFLVFISCLFVVSNVYCELAIPDQMQEIIIIIKSNGTIREILTKGIYMLGFAVASVCSIVVAKFFSTRVAIGLGRKIRSRIYDKVITFSDAEIKHFSTASLITRTTNDVTQVQNVVALGMTLLVKAPVMSIMAIVKIVNINMAWSLATASAVVGDVIDCASYDTERKFFGWEDKKEDYLADYLECETALYVRATGADKAAIEKAFGEVTFLTRENQAADEIAFVTPVKKEKHLRDTLASLDINILGTIRIADY